MTSVSRFLPFRRVCVVGSGVMGSGIAAHLANCGVSVLMLDVVPKAAGSSHQERNQIAAAGLQKALSIKPNAFMSKKDASRIDIGNLEDDLEKIRTCDLVIEVVLENLDVKRALFDKIAPYLNPGAVVTSNTSGLSIEGMTQGRSEEFKRRFLVTHFFNPVRYLHLLEIVTGPQTDKKVVERVVAFGENVLGKGIVYGKDTPNFVANRIGVFGMMETMRLMQEMEMSVEEVDAIFGPATGRPKSAVFRTADVVGLDTFMHVAQNCYDNLPQDERRDVFQIPTFLTQMVKNGALGQKSGQGFYKKEGADILAIDVKTLSYKSKQKVRYDSLGSIRHLSTLSEKLQSLVYAQDKAAQFAWKVSAAICVYAANRVGEIADDIVQIDNAMKWGFGWEMGPFEMWDAIGVSKSVQRMHEEGILVPDAVLRMLSTGRDTFYTTDKHGNLSAWDLLNNKEQALHTAEKTVSITLLKSHSTAFVKELPGVNLIDAGDGVLACEFTTKMNAIDNEVLAGINTAIDICEEGQFDALVLANDGANFSVGANILLLYMVAQQGEWGQIDNIVQEFQNVGRRLKYSSIPTVAAPFQLTLGGGCEVSLWCNRIRAHAETYMGLVEVGVGLIPGGGGNVRMLARSLWGAIDDPNYPTEQLIRRAVETVAMAKVSTSAEEARELMYLMPADGICMNRDQLLYAAKQEALGMARAGFKPPRETLFRLPGKSAYATFEMALKSMCDGHMMSEHDLKISLKVAHVMTGGDCTPRIPVTEQHLLDLEREAFLSLCGEEKTMARIAYMLENNKPLRN